MRMRERESSSTIPEGRIVSLGDSLLDWHRLDLKEDLAAMRAKVAQDLKSTPKNNLRTLSKMQRWAQNLDYIIERVTYAEEVLTPRLEGLFSFELNEKGLFTVALFQPSTKNLFLELEIHYCESGEAIAECKILPDLVALSETAKILALLGDAAIDMAILHHIWKPRASDVGSLTETRSGLVSNEHLSLKCDEWGLYENRIHFDPPTPMKSEMEHIKGTLVEALFGVIYIEMGFRRVLEMVKHLF
jgi:hypothetical protein